MSKTLFERLSKENQEKLMADNLSKLYCENILQKQHYYSEIPFSVAVKIMYTLYEDAVISPAKFYELFNNN